MSPIERSAGVGGASAGGLVKLFESTLGVAAASIDTGANGIAAGHGDLIAYITTRTTDAAAAANSKITINGDVTASYDIQFTVGSSTSTASGTTLAGNNWQAETHGNGGTAGYAGVIIIFIPAYSATTFNKVGTMQGFTVDATAVNCQAGVWSVGWRNTAAINQLTVAGVTGNLQAGSRLAVFGTE